MINIKNFSKNYGKIEAVKDLNLEIKAGELVGFVGKNGAGKSTTIRCMMNLISPSKGTITINGLDSIKDNKEIKKNISYIPSEPLFYNGITAETLLKFACKFTDNDPSIIKKLADYFELDLSKKVNELSLGNRKKVALIQAFLKKPLVIILDEPTSGLDPLMQTKFFELLLEYKSHGITIFLSSHNLAEIEKYCDKVAIIKQGQLVDYLDMKQVKFKHKQTMYLRLKDGSEINQEIDDDINIIIKQLANQNIEHLEIKNKTVEDEFMGYYEGEQNV